ncbi:MAG TPA: hypothetical protein VGQ83_35530 [Polyangia bacterium]
MTRTALLLTALLLAAAPARAEQRPTVAAARDPGTHFILQATAGLTVDGGAAPVYGAVFGVGGRPARSPLRLYALFEVAGATTDAAGVTPTGAYGATLRRVDIAAGLRFLLPVSGPLRIYADLLVGGTTYQASLERQGLDPRSSENGTALVDVAAGLDLRLVRNCSLGLRFKQHLLDPTPAWLAGLGAAPARSSDLSAAITLHF